MRYYVSSRSNNEELRKLFPMDKSYELTDTEVVGLIRQFGRASIDTTFRSERLRGYSRPREPDEHRLHFENEDD